MHFVSVGQTRHMTLDSPLFVHLYRTADVSVLGQLEIDLIIIMMILFGVVRSGEAK